MKLTGKTQIDIDNQIKLSDLEYELNINHKNVGLASKKKNKKIENGLDFESTIGLPCRSVRRWRRRWR